MNRIIILITISSLILLGLLPNASVPSTHAADPQLAKLADLFNYNAHFQKYTYSASISNDNGEGYDEASPIAGPELGANTIYLYYRDHGNPWTVEGNGIGLASSSDGGISFTVKQSNVLSRGGLCDLDSHRAVSPSVVYAPVPSPGSGYQYYMVYEGASLGICGPINLGSVFLATSSDGVIWQNKKQILTADLGCNNVGTPFIGFFNNNFYVFYHQACPIIPINPDLCSCRSKIMMASGSDPASLTKHGMAFDIGNGDNAWDSRVNSHASVVSEPDVTGQLWYYMAFEGSQSLRADTGNWGFGFARTKSIDNGPWEKYVYNPIRQTFNGALGNDLPSILQFNNAIRVFQRGKGQSNVLITGTTYPETVSNPNSVTYNHPGGDPSLFVFPARSQCNAYNDGLGRLDGDGISWSVNTQDDSNNQNKYMCKGPNITALPAGHYGVDFWLWIDVNTCPGWPSSCKVLGLDFVNDTASGQPSFHGASDQTSINRDKFQNAKTFQAFHNQFSAISGTQYEWRTFWSGTSYLKQSNVVLHYLDGAVDNSPPTTSMSPLPSNSPTSFLVSWSGSDSQSGISYFDVQSQDNNGGWTPWQMGTTATSFNFGGQCFHTYSFEVRARDNAGNLASYSAPTSTYTACDFGISANPTSVSVVAGSTGSSIITVTPTNGFTGTVTLSASPAPTGLTCSFSSTTITGGSGSQTLYCNGGSVGTSYAVTVTGSSGSLTHTTTTTFTFMDFTISPSPASVSIRPGGSATSTINLRSLYGAGTVSLSSSQSVYGTPPHVDGWGSGYCHSALSRQCTANLSTNSAGDLIVVFASSPTTLTNGFTISDTAGLTYNQRIFSQVQYGNQFQDISVAEFWAIAPSTLTSDTITMTTQDPAFCCPLHNLELISFGVSGSGYQSDTSPVAAIQSTGNPTVNAVTTGPNRMVIGYAVDGTQSLTAGQGFVFLGSSGNNGSEFAIIPNAGPVSVSFGNAQGEWAEVADTIQPPPGFSFSFAPQSVPLASGGSGSSVLTITAASFVPIGTYTVSVTGAVQSLAHTVPITVNIANFGVSANPTTVINYPGSLATSTITVNPVGGFTGTVTLTANNGACSLNPASVTGSGSSTLSCSNLNTAPTTVIVTGTSGSESHTAAVTYVPPYSFRDDFPYTSVSNMVSAGWTVCGTQNGQVGVGNSILTLTNDATNVGQMCWSNIPSGVTSWTVTTRGQYASQLCCYPPTNGATWVTVTTATHTYQFDLDGYYSSYYLFRDGVRVQTVGGYTPQLGAWHDLTLDMRNGIITAIADGKIITSYTEFGNTNNPPGNALARITMNPGWDTVTNFDWETVTQVNDAFPSDFIIGTSPISVKTGVGTNAATTINLSSLRSFSGTVALTSSISPATGLTCSLNPTSVSLTSSATSTLTCNGSTGTYKVTVKGTSGTLSHITNATITMVRYTLSLQGFDYDGGQEETIKLNNVQVAQLPAADSPQNAQIYVTFTLDITSFVVKGTNTLTFTHANWDCTVVDNTKNVQITDSTGTVIFSDPTVRPLSCTQSITYTFTI